MPPPLPPAQPSATAMSDNIPFAQAVRTWARIALLSFGGPAGQIAVMHRILVEEKRWIGEQRFLHALNFCMLLPGPEAQQLATYAGWLTHGLRGGFCAGLLFILPGFLAILALSLLYTEFGQLAWVGAAFVGLKAAVLVVVLQALQRLGGRALQSRPSQAIALAAFVAIFVFGVPFPLIVIGAGLLGSWLLLERSRPASDTRAEDADAAPLPRHCLPQPRRDLGLAALLLLLWLAPVGALLLALGPNHVFSQIGLLFSKLAVVTFGGAYAVLAYVAQAAVEQHHWLSAGEMLDGLALAETTPGPLIMVLQFVGYLAALRGAEGLAPLAAGLLGAGLTVWVTFVPCFLWVLSGAPYLEQLRERRRLNAALRGVTAAVVGVILNLALWLGLHCWFAEVGSSGVPGLALPWPDTASLRVDALALTVLAALAAWGLRWGLASLLLVGAGSGLLLFALR